MTKRKRLAVILAGGTASILLPLICLGVYLWFNTDFSIKYACARDLSYCP
jgi:hypothetical protein